MDASIKELKFFVIESNRIEGILTPPTLAVIEATASLLCLDAVTIPDLQKFVSACQPGAFLRDEEGMDVRVGKHHPPPGGTDIPVQLQRILDDANSGSDPYDTHIRYETLHPFIDGNGRSGRVLWAWQMLKLDMWPKLKLGFLHAFYYQALDHSDLRNPKAPGGRREGAS